MTPQFVRLTGRSKPTADAPAAATDALRICQAEYLEGELDPNAPDAPAQPRGRGWAKVLLPNGVDCDLWAFRAAAFGDTQLNDDTTLTALTQPRAQMGQGAFGGSICRFIIIQPLFALKLQAGPGGAGTMAVNQLGTASYMDRKGNETRDIPVFNPPLAYQEAIAKDDILQTWARWLSGEPATLSWVVGMKPGGASVFEFIEIIGGQTVNGQPCIQYSATDPVSIPIDPSGPGPYPPGLGTGTLYRNGQPVGLVWVRQDYSAYVLPLLSGRRMTVGRRTSHDVGGGLSVTWYHPTWE